MSEKLRVRFRTRPFTEPRFAVCLVDGGPLQVSVRASGDTMRDALERACWMVRSTYRSERPLAVATRTADAAFKRGGKLEGDAAGG